MTRRSAMPWPPLSFDEATARLIRPGSPFEVGEAVIRGIPTRVWVKAPPTLRDVFLAGRAFGSRTFLVYEDERASFEAFSRAALAVAERLQREGVRKGDRVAIAMRNLPEWPAAFFGALLCGAIATPLNAWWTTPELQYGLVDAGAVVAFVDAERWARIENAVDGCPELRRVFVSRAAQPIAHPRVAPLESITGAIPAWRDLPDRPVPEIDLQPEDDATIFYTSGTTGQPKGALGTHRNAASGVLAHPYSLARSILRRGDALPEPDAAAPRKASLVSIPLFHVTGCHATLVSGLYRGTKLVLTRRWDPEQAFRLIERERCTTAGGVPTIAWQLLEHPARASYDLSSLETVSYGGAPAPAELVRRIRAVFPNAQPATGWGMTETSSTFTHHQAEDYEHRPDSCGPPLPICDIRIADPDGRCLPAGEAGELWARGPIIVKSYWNKPDATAATFVDGWLRTGDIARLDEEGFCFIIDRAKDMVIRGGENIASVEVENALYEHPAVMDAAVVPIAHPTLGEEPGAVVTLSPGLAVTEAELRAFVAGRLAAYKVPVKILFWPEVLPRNANGKILKADLKRAFA